MRYRIHNNKIYGKPDICNGKHRIVVFIDGDWWHGRNFIRESSKYPDFWKTKISNNMKRDRLVNKKLRAQGWKVFRFWQKDIEKNCEKYSDKVFEYLNKQS